MFTLLTWLLNHVANVYINPACAIKLNRLHDIKMNEHKTYERKVSRKKNDKFLF